jgi:hypothetical protein
MGDVVNTLAEFSIGLSAVLFVLGVGVVAREAWDQVKDEQRRGGRR